MKITKEMFTRQRSPRFGTANPERIHNEFWEWMIRGDAPEGSDSASASLVLEDGKVRAAKFPYQVRQQFGVEYACGDGPIWTFDRMGATHTKLADGRIVCVGGEYEDFYDPDFYIYNDVIVIRPDGEIEIYGYPKETFSPTDFHTTTAFGDKLLIIGSIGYKADRVLGRTSVFSLDLSTYEMTEVQTSGVMPGWISKHAAEIDSTGVIAVRGGRILKDHNGNRSFVRNIEDFAFNPRNSRWEQISNRNWRQFSVSQEDGKWFPVQPRLLSVEDLVPEDVERTANQPESSLAEKIVIKGVPVLLEVGLSAIEVVVEGELPNEIYERLRENIRGNAEVFLKKRCVLHE
jgi:hypothetical protein